MLGNSTQGRALLTTNLQTGIAINNAATPAQGAQAVFDAFAAVNGAGLADGLGPVLGGIYRQSNTVNANGTYGYLSADFKKMWEYRYNLVADTKSYYATGTNGGASGPPIPDLPLPPGGQTNVYDRFYAPTDRSKNGNSRPFLAAPGAFKTFNGADPFGNPVSSADLLKQAHDSASFPSGHSYYGNASSLLMAYMVPERFQEMLTRGSEQANGRVVIGIHYPLDAIGGRISGLYEMVTLLNNNPEVLNVNLGNGVAPVSDFAGLVASNTAQLRGALEAGCGTSIANCLAQDKGDPADRFAVKAQNKADYTYRLTYGLPSVGPTNLAPVVPTGAEVLLLTRFPYLSADQRRDVLATTELPSGVPLDGNTDPKFAGYARLNLYAAADGYGAFNGPVTVTMDASKSGFNAFDTWGNDIGGSGSLTKAGTGTLTLTGTNTYAGGTTIQGGTLIGSASSLGSGPILDNAALVIAQAADGTLASPISGTGTLTKIGAGTLTLGGIGTLSGPTVVAQGRLAVNGALANSVVTVGPGANLGGSGTVGGITTLTGATVAPGNSIGTLNVAGNVAFAAGSTYQVEANAAGQSDRIAAGGTATLNGGTVQVLAASGTYNPRTTYAILNAAGGVAGRFAGVTSNMAFLSPGLRYRPTEVDLTLTRNDIPFASIATTRNAASVAGAIQAAGTGRGIYDATVGLSTPEAQGAFRALAGDIHGSTVSTAYETAFFVREAILDRLRWGTMPGAAASLDDSRLPATYTADLPGRAPVISGVPARILDPQVFGMWGQGFGAFGDASGGGNAFGVNRQIAGFAAGADVRLPSGFKFGLVGGYTESTLGTTGGLESATIKSGFGGVYGGYETGPISVRLGAVYADNDTRTRRSVLYGLSDNPTGHGGGSTIQGFGEIGYRFFLGQAAPAILVSKNGPQPVLAQPAPTSIEPFVGGAYVGVHRDRFAETGGVAALTSFARDYDLGAMTVGVRAQTSLDLGLGLPVSAHGLIGYRRAFGDVVPAALLAFGNGPTFLTTGVPIDRDALVAEAGLDLAVAPNTTLGIAYTGQAGSRAQDQAVKGNFVYRF